MDFTDMRPGSELYVIEACREGEKDGWWFLSMAWTREEAEKWMAESMEKDQGYFKHLDISYTYRIRRFEEASNA